MVKELYQGVAVTDDRGVHFYTQDQKGLYEKETEEGKTIDDNRMIVNSEWLKKPVSESTIDELATALYNDSFDSE